MCHGVFNRIMYENTDYIYTTVEQQSKITHIFCVKSDVYRLTLIFFYESIATVYIFQRLSIYV